MATLLGGVTIRVPRRSINRCPRLGDKLGAHKLGWRLRFKSEILCTALQRQKMLSKCTNKHLIAGHEVLRTREQRVQSWIIKNHSNSRPRVRKKKRGEASFASRIQLVLTDYERLKRRRRPAAAMPRPSSARLVGSGTIICTSPSRTAHSSGPAFAL